MNFINTYIVQIVETAILIFILGFIRWILKRAVINFTLKIERYEKRTRLILKHINILIFSFFVFLLILIWGVDLRNVEVVFTSVFAIIGIAFFAQWSILSNITSGIIMFFTFPYKIGDFIRIQDKDFPSEGRIEDIRTFHTILRTSQGELITYPNSLMLQKGVSILDERQNAGFSSENDKNKEHLPHG